MSKDHPSYLMVVNNGRLLPAHPLDQERLMTFANGTEVECQFKSVKNGLLIRKLYVVTGLAVKQCPTPWKTADEAIQWMKDRLGLVDTSKGYGDTQLRYLRSLNDVDEPELLEFMEGCWLLLQKATGVDPLTLRKEAGDTILASDPSAPSSGSVDDVHGGEEATLARQPLAATIPQDQIGEAARGAAADDPKATDAPSSRVSVATENDVPDATPQSAASGEAAPPKPAVSPPDRAEMISKLFRLAAEPLTIEERLASLKTARAAWEKVLGADAVRMEFDTIEKVIKGELPVDAARRFLAESAGG